MYHVLTVVAVYYLVIFSLYSHALLIPLKPSKSKYQVDYEQKFKDLLSSTCQVSV